MEKKLKQANNQLCFRTTSESSFMWVLKNNFLYPVFSKQVDNKEKYVFCGTTSSIFIENNGNFLASKNYVKIKW
jgi:hypothetical protein